MKNKSQSDERLETAKKCLNSLLISYPNPRKPEEPAKRYGLMFDINAEIAESRLVAILAAHDAEVGRLAKMEEAHWWWSNFDELTSRKTYDDRIRQLEAEGRRD